MTPSSSAPTLPLCNTNAHSINRKSPSEQADKNLRVHEYPQLLYNPTQSPHPIIPPPLSTNIEPTNPPSTIRYTTHAQHRPVANYRISPFPHGVGLSRITKRRATRSDDPFTCISLLDLAPDGDPTHKNPNHNHNLQLFDCRRQICSDPVPGSIMGVRMQ